MENRERNQTTQKENTETGEEPSNTERKYRHLLPPIFLPFILDLMNHKTQNNKNPALLNLP
jgi:hypothetical protein